MGLIITVTRLGNKLQFLYILNQRVCKFCKTLAIEDETHFLISCEFYSDIRYDLLKHASDTNTNFPAMTNTNKFISLSPLQLHGIMRNE